VTPEVRLSPLTSICQRAKLHAGIKPTALCSALDKENSIESSLDSVHYLYNRSNPNPVLSPALPYESTCSHASIITNLKEKKKKRKTIFKTKGKEKKRNIK